MEKGKSIEELMGHIREAHGIAIDANQERELLNMGYFHGYKAYRFVRNTKNMLSIDHFSEIQAVFELDNDLKALLYPVVMKIETAISNYTIECIVAEGEVDLESIFKTKLNHYSDYEVGSRLYRKEMAQWLNLRKTIDGVISANYVKSHMIQHFVHKNRPVPVWGLLELMTLGNLGMFIGRLNNSTRSQLATMIGIDDKRIDTADTLLIKHIYLIKDLRNAIAHNSPVFDCRFRKSSVDSMVNAHLEINTGVAKINFLTITDYMLLFAYYLKVLTGSVVESNELLVNFELVMDAFSTKILNRDNYWKIFDVDAKSKIEHFRENA
jgi:abortive infection bacteriophage resistance protein